MGGEWEVSWDGLYQPELGSAGIGIMVEHPWAAPLVSLSVPVSAADATHMEALGPALASLLLASWFSVARVCFKGDSSYVVGLLDYSRRPWDIFFFNCIELTRDVLTGWVYHAVWVPHNQNVICDALARQAAASGEIVITINSDCSPSMLAMLRKAQGHWE